MSKAASLEDEFEKIIQKAIREAEKVPCELNEFLDGLKGMRSSLQERINITEAEVGSDAV